jgi:hypothetical protein
VDPSVARATSVSNALLATDPHDLSRLRHCEYGQDLRYQGKCVRQSVRASTQDNDCEGEIGKVLLESEIAVDRDEGVDKSRRRA